MNTNQTLAVLKAFYFGSDSMAAIAHRTNLSRDEVREALRGARECGLIKYSTRDYNETFVHKDSKKLGEYLKAKGLIQERKQTGYKKEFTQERKQAGYKKEFTQGKKQTGLKKEVRYKK